MTKFRGALLSWTLLLGFGLGWATPRPAFGQAVPPPPTGAPPTAAAPPVVGGNPSAKNPDNPASGGGNYDYFTADLDPGLSKYLAIVSYRHVGQIVWTRFWSGNYTEPLADCRYALERFPNHPRALHLVGEIAKATNQPAMAIPYFEFALKMYPQYSFTHAQYGHYLIDIGATSAGVVELREALRLDPKQFQAKAWLAEALAAHPELGTAGPAPGPAKGGAVPNSSGAQGSR